MEHRRKKICCTAQLCIAIIIIIASFISISCNSRAFITLDKNGTDATIQVNIAFSPFFVAYLRDLMGFRAFSDIVGLGKFREFFEEQPNTSYVSGSVSNEPETITVTIKTTNVPMLLSKFGVPIKKENEKLNIQITRELIKALLDKLPAFENIDFHSLFISDEQVVTKTQFPKYIAWALGDYATKDSVQKTVEKSHINISLQKDAQNPITIDTGWQKTDEKTQEMYISLVDMLYEDSYNIWYSH